MIAEMPVLQMLVLRWFIQNERDVMLVLSRKKNESIVINDNITIVVVDIRGDKIRLGIDAPSSVPVHRKEVYDEIQKEKRGEKEPRRKEGSDNS